jgi:hypothetical protein
MMAAREELSLARRGMSIAGLQVCKNSRFDALSRELAGSVPWVGWHLRQGI